MVKFIKDFVLKGDHAFVFDTIRSKVPEFLNREDEDGYHILEEIQEPNRMYRKAKIEKKSFLNRFPRFIRERLPRTLLETSTKLLEENIFYEEEKKIQWTISSQLDDIYVLHGTTKFIEIDQSSCKVMVLLYMELHHLEHYFPNQVARGIVKPFIETKVPEYFLSSLKQVYKEILDENLQT